VNPREADPDRDPVAHAEALAVPVIDLEAADAAERIAAACRDWGFFQVVNHGVPETLVDAAWRETRAFFAGPAEAKRALTRSLGNPWGFYDSELTKNRRDRKEVFDYTAEGVDPIYNATNRWPAQPESFRETMTRYLDACAALSIPRRTAKCGRSRISSCRATRRVTVPFRGASSGAAVPTATTPTTGPRCR